MILGVIPARYESSRFPGKPLVDIQGKSMIQRVYEQAGKASLLDQVLVATDDERIFTHVKSFGGKVEMTGSHHRSGTERLVEIAEKVPGYEYLINIQGDEPFIDPSQIDVLCNLLQKDAQVQIATLVHRVKNSSDLFNPNMPKVVLDNQGCALYFSRSPIPFIRNQKNKEKWLEEHSFFQHIGIYAFKRSTLLQVPHMEKSLLEESESLEQLRWLANGYKIHTAISDKVALSIDSPEDLQRLLESLP